MSTPLDPRPTRRRFLSVSGTAVAGVSIAAKAAAMPVHLGGSDVIRVGLIGCGGRGTGAALNALKADPQARLVAMGDLFADRLNDSLTSLQNSEVKAQVTVDADHRFTDFSAFDGVIKSSDVVLLCTSPHYRPQHLRAAIEAGKHVFCEKPVATDAPGLRSVMETCKLAQQKQLSLVSGLCYRYQKAKRDVIQRVHEGAVGDIVALQCTYNTGFLWHRGHKPEWSDMEYQNRNWLYFTWLSGDHIAEQSIHSLDKILWAMKDEAPERVTASGGRSTRVQPEFGNVYDHFNTVFEWKNGVKLFHSCRQWGGADGDVSDFVFGTKGTAAIQTHAITGENAWRHRGDPGDMYQFEHDELFRSIREGKPINNGDYMCKATLMSIMGRMSAYTGKTITWEQALNSKQDLSPAGYAWGPAPEPIIAIPGKTEFL
ncbi:MAG: Gfo/Idh/MocA family oxidoreductase [Planctomycetota bacterium]